MFLVSRFCFTSTALLIALKRVCFMNSSFLFVGSVLLISIQQFSLFYRFSFVDLHIVYVIRLVTIEYIQTEKKINIDVCYVIW